jgi:hypothetical protein
MGRTEGESFVSDYPLAAAAGIRSKNGKENNKEAIKLLHPYFSNQKGNFYNVDKELFRFGPSLSCQVKALGHVYLNDVGTFYWIQFRKTGVLYLNDLEIIAAVLRMTFLDQPDFRKFGFKLLDIGAAPHEKRTLREYDLRELRELSPAAINEFFAPVHQAILELRSEGFEPAKREKTRKESSDRQQYFEF